MPDGIKAIYLSEQGFKRFIVEAVMDEGPHYVGGSSLQIKGALSIDKEIAGGDRVSIPFGHFASNNLEKEGINKPSTFEL